MKAAAILHLRVLGAMHRQIQELEAHLGQLKVRYLDEAAKKAAEEEAAEAAEQEVLTRELSLPGQHRRKAGCSRRVRHWACLGDIDEGYVG